MSQRKQTHSGGASREAQNLLIDYTTNPWCVACGAFDPEYRYSENLELLLLTCNRCGFMYDMKPKWSAPADQVLY